MDTIKKATLAESIRLSYISYKDTQDLIEEMKTSQKDVKDSVLRDFDELFTALNKGVSMTQTLFDDGKKVRSACVSLIMLESEFKTEKEYKAVRKKFTEFLKNCKNWKEPKALVSKTKIDKFLKGLTDSLKDLPESEKTAKHIKEYVEAVKSSVICTALDITK